MRVLETKNDRGRAQRPIIANHNAGQLQIHDVIPGLCENATRLVCPRPSTCHRLAFPACTASPPSVWQQLRRQSRFLSVTRCRRLASGKGPLIGGKTEAARVPAQGVLGAEAVVRTDDQRTNGMIRWRGQFSVIVWRTWLPFRDHSKDPARWQRLQRHLETITYRSRKDSPARISPSSIPRRHCVEDAGGPADHALPRLRASPLPQPTSG